MGNNSDMVWLLVLFVLLFLLLLLAVPIVVTVRVRAGVRGAAVRATAWLFGLIPIPIRLRIALFSKPYFTLCYKRKRAPLLQKRAPSAWDGVWDGVRILRTDSVLTVGVRDDPAHSVLLLGLGVVALSCLTPRISEQGTVSGKPSFAASMARLTLNGMALVLPLKCLWGVVRAWRIMRTNPAKTTDTIQEKRQFYASG